MAITARLCLCLLILLGAAGLVPARTQITPKDPPTVAFCEMIRRPKLYFDKPVRVTATLQLATEGMYVVDEQCPLNHDDQIGASSGATGEQQRAAVNETIRKVRTTEFGGRAVVTAIGILRNSSRRDFVWYRYRFDFVRVEKVSHVVVPYQGELQGTITYRAVVRGDRQARLALVPAVRMPLHYALHLDWINLNEFPSLKKLQESQTTAIVFSVVFDELKQITEQRWNRTTRCKIISVL